jgi:hypothetical protein
VAEHNRQVGDPQVPVPAQAVEELVGGAGEDVALNLLAVRRPSAGLDRTGGRRSRR